ncbi:MAG: hypothetical protein ACTS4U_00535 [Candidatus Hodgkinia cicadicola]
MRQVVMACNSQAKGGTICLTKQGKRSLEAMVEISMNRNSFCKTLAKVVRNNRTTSIFRGKLVKSYVVFKSNEFALVDIGFTQNVKLRSNGTWKYENLKVGNMIKVYVENVGRNGEDVLVSRRELDLDETWDVADDLCKSGGEVLAKVVGMNRNGIGMEVFGMFGAIFWTRELIKLENEIRKRSFLMTRVKATCRRHNLIVLTPSRPIEDSDQRRPSCTVWTEVIDLCDDGVWTLVDGCYGIVTLSGKPWCKALDLINQTPFGEVILSDFVKLEKTVKPKRSEDLIDLLVNSIIEVADATKWDENVITVNVICVWEWVTSLASADRERWHEWRRQSCWGLRLRFACGSFDGPSRFGFSEEYWSEVRAEGREQNRLWSVERNELGKLLCGFDWNRFKVTCDVLEMTLRDQITQLELEWFEKMKNAWLSEGGTFVTERWKWWMLPAWERRRVIDRLKRRQTPFGNAWKRELEWEAEQKLRNVERLEFGQTHSAEMEIQKDGNLQIEGTCNLQREPKGNGIGKVNINAREEVDDVERTLNAEWEGRWNLERGPQVWKRHYAETDNSVIETSYGNLTGVRALRPVYGIIIGMDVQAKMLVAAVNGKILTYVCDLSISNEEVALLQSGWRDDCAVRMVPIALSYGLDDVLVEINVDGYKCLKFVDEQMGKTLVGKVVSFEGNEVLVDLGNGIYGQLRLAGARYSFGIEVGMEVDVMITDFNPVTISINLELSEEEEVRTILVET